MVLQNYKNFIEMTSNMIYIVALGGGFKCLRKIHLNTQCPLPCSFGSACLFDNWHLRELEIGSVFCNILTVQAVVIDCRLS